MQRSYHPDGPGSNAERQRRFKQRRREARLERIGENPLSSRQEADARAALQHPPPEQFGDKGRSWRPGDDFGFYPRHVGIAVQRQFERVHAEDEGAPLSVWERTFIGWDDKRRKPTVLTGKLKFKNGSYRRVPIAPATDRGRHIAVTPELERHYLAALARLEARDAGGNNDGEAQKDTKGGVCNGHQQTCFRCARADG